MLYGQRYREPRRGILGQVLDAAAMLITIIAALLLLLIGVASRVNPNTFWPFAFISLAAPAIFFVNIILMFYWIMRWRRIFILPALLLLLNMNGISAFFKPIFSKEYEKVNKLPDGAVKVVSYNVGGFFRVEESGVSSVVDSTLSYIKNTNADIICLQEFEANYKHPKHKIDSLLTGWPYCRTLYTIRQGEDNGWGLAVYSRYPIISSGGIEYPSNNGSMWVDVLINRDTLHIFNNHLQSTSVSAQERMMFEILQENHQEFKQERLREVVYKLRENYKLRAVQADSIASIISQKSRRTIVCGDFNDTPLSYTYRKMKGNLKDAFQQGGKGMINTYRGLLGVLRIDYIFHSEDIATAEFKLHNSDLSDHNAVEASILLQ